MIRKCHVRIDIKSKGYFSYGPSCTKNALLKDFVYTLMHQPEQSYMWFFFISIRIFLINYFFITFF